MALLDNTGLERLWAHIMSVIGGKVDAEDGKGLSTNDYTTEDKNKLDTLTDLVGDTSVADQIADGIAGISHPVTSVNNKTGVVNLTYSDVGAEKSGAANTAFNSAKSYTDLQIAAITHPVTKVNNKTGVVTLTAADVGADAAGTAATLYAESLAYTEDRLADLVGDTKVSTQIDNAIVNKVDKEAGKGLSTNDYTTAEKNKLANITASADSVSFTQSVTSGTKIGTITINGSGTDIYAPAQSATNATQSAAGLMSADDKKKLDGIATGANKTTVDTELSSSSTNPVQNKVVQAAIGGIYNTISTLVGDTSVADQIDNALEGIVDATIFYVTFTKQANDEYTADKTFAEISNAYLGGQYVVGIVDRNETFMPHIQLLYFIRDSIIGFYGLTNGKNSILLYMLADGSLMVEELDSFAFESNITDAIAAIEYPVTKVNNQTGAINLTYSDVGADASGSASSALTQAKNYTDTELTRLVGDTNVSTQIDQALGTVASGVPIVTASSTNGYIYTATAAGITSLKTGTMLIIVPNMDCNSQVSVLNVNNLGNKYIARRVSYSNDVEYLSSLSWLKSGKPYLLVYDGEMWVAEGGNTGSLIVVSDTQPASPATGTLWFQI